MAKLQGPIGRLGGWKRPVLPTLTKKNDYRVMLQQTSNEGMNPPWRLSSRIPAPGGYLHGSTCRSQWNNFSISPAVTELAKIAELKDLHISARYFIETRRKGILGRGSYENFSLHVVSAIDQISKGREAMADHFKYFLYHYMKSLFNYQMRKGGSFLDPLKLL
ncbi:hypothetical protein [Erwinia tasmaniensis]|uniref:hypothetical protein n=1 Tax=Erwinia tasmaniensis TaxID=338565 RepID=UPI003A4D6A02